MSNFDHIIVTDKSISSIQTTGDKIMNIPRFSSSMDLYNFLKSTNTKLVLNTIHDSPEHQLSEIDNFMRAHHLGHVHRDVSYLLLQRETDITTIIEKYYGTYLKNNCNLDYVIDSNAFAMSYEIARLVPELCIDINLSHLKTATTERRETTLVKASSIMFYAGTNKSVLRAHRDYFERRHLTQNFDPWSSAAPPISNALAEFLGGTIDRIAVVHYRQNVRNASIPIPAGNLAPSLAYLRDNRYTIVKIGTEPYPEEFSQFGVIDYTASEIKSFENDIALLKITKIALVNAYETENLLDFMNVPVVSYGRWHLTLAPCSSKAVIVPVLLFDRKRERIATFAEQIYCFLTAPEYWESEGAPWRFPAEHYAARPPQEDELLAALKEALELAEQDIPRSALQEQFSELEPNGCLPLLKSRISQHFLEKFRLLV